MPDDPIVDDKSSPPGSSAVFAASRSHRQQTYTAMLGRMAYQRMRTKSWPLLLDEIRTFIDAFGQGHHRRVCTRRTQSRRRADD